MLLKFNVPNYENKKLIKTRIYKNELQFNKYLNYLNQEEIKTISLLKFHNIIRIPNNSIMLKLNEYSLIKEIKYFTQEEIENNINIEEKFIKKIYFKVLHDGKTFILSSKYFKNDDND